MVERHLDSDVAKVCRAGDKCYNLKDLWKHEKKEDKNEAACSA